MLLNEDDLSMNNEYFLWKSVNNENRSSKVTC